MNRLFLAIEDNGEGLAVTPERAADPFYSTKKEQKTGLGLSLLQAAAEISGGALKLNPSSLGGLAVEASMQLDHINRPPFGDIADTLAAACGFSPDLEIELLLERDRERRSISIRSALDQLPESSSRIAVAAKAAGLARQGLCDLGFVD